METRNRGSVGFHGNSEDGPHPAHRTVRTPRTAPCAPWAPHPAHLTLSRVVRTEPASLTAAE